MLAASDLDFTLQLCYYEEQTPNPKFAADNPVTAPFIVDTADQLTTYSLKMGAVLLLPDAEPACGSIVYSLVSAVHSIDG